MTSRFPISRRTFLAGAGAAISLPFLEAMLPRGTAYAQAGNPTRMIAYYVPCGMHMTSFTPTLVGPNFDLPPVLQPFADVQDEIMILTGLRNEPAVPDLPAGDHMAGTGAFLTATKVKRTQTDIENGISVDQVVANALSGTTAFPSLQLGMDGGESTGNCDSGYSCAYARNISWAGPKTPLPKQVNPQIVFDRLFGGFRANESQAEREARQQEDLSILDFVTDDIDELNGLLGARDRQKLDEYLTGLRALEQRINGLDPNTMCGIPVRPNASYNVSVKAEIMADLMVAALECDQTRVISFMLGNAGSYRHYGFLGIDRQHHQLSHHQMRPDYLADLERVNIWEMEQVAYIVRKLRDTTDAMDRPLIESTSLFMSSEISDGQAHNHDDMPILMAGQANGAFQTGRHLIYDEEEMGNLYVSWLNAMGVPDTTFGQSGTRPLTGLS